MKAASLPTTNLVCLIGLVLALLIFGLANLYNVYVDWTLAMEPKLVFHKVVVPYVIEVQHSTICVEANYWNM